MWCVLDDIHGSIAAQCSPLNTLCCVSLLVDHLWLLTLFYFTPVHVFLVSTLFVLLYTPEYEYVDDPLSPPPSLLRTSFLQDLLANAEFIRLADAIVEVGCRTPPRYCRIIVVLWDGVV